MWGSALCLLVVVAFGWRPWLVMVCQQQGRAELAAHRYERARRWLDRSLAWNDQNPATHFLLARLHRKQGDSFAFQRHLLRAGELGFSRERCRRERWLAEAQAGQIDDADGHYLQLVEDPGADAAEICEAYANGHMMNGRFQEAMRILEGWQSMDPSDGQPHYMRGLIWQHLGDYRAAESAFRKALSLTPDHHRGALALAEMLIERNRLDETPPLFALAMEHPATWEQAAIGQAKCLRMQAESSRARELLREVLDRDPRSVSALIQLGQLELSAGNAEQAEQLLREAYTQRPADPNLRYVLATALNAVGKDAEAAQHFDYATRARRALDGARREIIQLNDQPRDAEARARVGDVLLRFGHPREGLAWLRSAVNLDPRCAPAHAALSEYYSGPGADQPDASRLARYHRRQAAEHAEESLEEDRAGPES